MSFHCPNHPMWNNGPEVLTAAFAALELKTSAPPSSPVSRKRPISSMAPEPTLGLVKLGHRKILRGHRKVQTINKPARCASDPGTGASANRVSVEICGLLLYEPTEGVEEPPQKKQSTEKHRSVSS